MLFPPGDAVDETFMAAGFASYVEHVAAAGAVELDVPLFVNAWLNTDSVLEGAETFSGGKRPGEYPSGGPVLPVASIWEELAPSIDLLAPDVYLHDAEPVLAGFANRNGRLLVPEIRADARGIAQMFSAVGRHRAAGVAPFGADGLEPGTTASAALEDAFRLLSVVADLIRGDPSAVVQGFLLDDTSPSSVVRSGRTALRVELDEAEATTPRPRPGYGVAVRAGDALVLLGRGFCASPVSDPDGSAAFLSVEACEMTHEGLRVSARLNGDETGGGTAVRFPFLHEPRPHDAPIPALPYDSGVVRIETYTF